MNGLVKEKMYQIELEILLILFIIEERIRHVNGVPDSRFPFLERSGKTFANDLCSTNHGRLP